MQTNRERYLFVEQPIGAFVVNFALNALIAWGVFRGATRVPLWGDTSVAGDTIATSCILPFLSVLIATPLVRRDARLGKISPPGLPDRGRLVQWLPRRLVPRALVLALMGLVVVGPLVVLGLWLADVTEVAMPRFIWVKAAYAAALGALLAPTIARAALADTRAAAAPPGGARPLGPAPRSR
jgi:hypothetical protein